jgi:signal transduction histidine kinase
VLCLVATAGVTFHLEASRDEEARRVAHSSSILLAAEELGSSLRVAAGTLHASLGAGEAWEREVTARELSRLEPRLARLELLVQGDPAQRARVERLAPAVRGAGASLAGALAAGWRGEREAVAETALRVGPEVRALADGPLAEVQRAEQAELARRHLAWRRRSVLGAVVFTVASVALLVLLVGAARLVAAEMRARERLSAERAGMLEVQQQLMAVVSHDLRNPLATMKGAASLIARGPAPGADHREEARRIVSNARRMERLIRDLLDFSRLRAGVGLPVTPTDTDLVEVCRRAVADLGRDAEGVVAVDERGDPTGRWDPDRLEQVVQNLVTNALKYGPASAPVRILVDGAGDEVRLLVHDEGGGIPPALHAAIFEPFRRGRAGDAEATRSAGLGLYIVRRIAEAHGGAADVDSAPGRGTTFTVRLPRRAAPAAPAAADG